MKHKTGLNIESELKFCFSQSVPNLAYKAIWGVFQLEMVKIVLASHFHKKVRATIGLVPTLQLP